MTTLTPRTTTSSDRPRITSAPTSVPRPDAPSLPAVRWAPLIVALLAALALDAYVWSAHGAQPAILLLLGVGLGVALFHSRFGFTSAWRQLVAVGNGTGLRAHALLLGTTATLFALIIGTGSGLFGSAPEPSSGPLGVALVLGAFLFGIGMQLGGACASGTLFAVGSGQSAIVLTLLGFIGGSVLYAWQFDLVKDLPELPPVMLADSVGWGGSLAITLAVLAAVVLISRAIQARRLPPPVGAVPSARGILRAVRGSWPLLVGAVVLAVLASGVLLVAGGAWGITSAFALAGSKALELLGANPETWTYWQQPDNAEKWAAPMLTDKTTLTDIGIVLGAAVASAAAGAWTLHRKIPAKTAAAALLGGLIMGIGARLAGGCNIGAYLGGIASGSLHGWAWAAAALVGTWVGLRARTWFGLANPKPKDTVC